MYRTDQFHPKSRTKWLIIAGAIVLCGVIVMGVLEATDVTHYFHKDKSAAEKVKTPTVGGGASYTDKGATQKPGTATPSSSESNTNTKETGNAGTIALVEPTGNFVSAHKVPSNAPLTSVCNTTPGATCTITFTRDGIQKSLTPQTTDSGGSTYWSSWTPASLGITSGTWSIKAVASLGGQQKSASDAMNLEVTP